MQKLKKGSYKQKIYTEFLVLSSPVCFYVSNVKFLFLVPFCMELPQLSVPNKLETFQAPPFPIVKFGQYICTYTLVAPKGTRIRFWFDKFGTEIFNSTYFYLWVRFLMCKNILQLLFSCRIFI